MYMVPYHSILRHIFIPVMHTLKAIHQNFLYGNWYAFHSKSHKIGICHSCNVNDYLGTSSYGLWIKFFPILFSVVQLAMYSCFGANKLTRRNMGKTIHPLIRTKTNSRLCAWLSKFTVYDKLLTWKLQKKYEKLHRLVLFGKIGNHFIVHQYLLSNCNW